MTINEGALSETSVFVHLVLISIRFKNVVLYVT